MKAFVVLVTTPNRKTSEKLSKGLIHNKLAACVNTLPGLKSRYWWKGKIETAREELLLIKTNQSRLLKLIRWLKENHPYEICEIVALPISAGHKSYLNWIDQSVRF